MSNVVYPGALEAFLSAQINLTTHTIKAALVTSTYVYSSAHDFYNDVSGVVGTDQTLGTKTVTSGQFGAANSTWTAVAAGSTVRGIVIYRDTGVASTSRLLAFIDTRADGAPLSIATDGGNITITWAGGLVFRI
jgi:hypothetical protein